MLKPMIRTIDRWRFELPLALTLGAAVAFVTIAAPHEFFGGLPGAEASAMQVLLQDLAAIVFGLFATSIAYLAMRRPNVPGPTIMEGQGEVDNWLEPKDAATPEAVKPAKAAAKSAAKGEALVSAEPQIRLRRADAHPDAPPRAPIRASRDLGEPFMDIDGFAPPPVLAPLPVPPAAIIDGDFFELDAPKPVEEPPVAVASQPIVEAAPEPAPIIEPAPVAEAEPVAEVEPVIETPPAPVQPVAEEPVAVPPVEAPIAAEPSPIEAFEPEAEPMPAPVRPSRQSLGSMMERLSSGLERRNGQPLAPPPAAAVAEALSGPRDVKPELRNALDELNRLAARRD